MLVERKYCCYGVFEVSLVQMYAFQKKTCYTYHSRNWRNTKSPKSSTNVMQNGGSCVRVTWKSIIYRYRLGHWQSKLQVHCIATVTMCLTSQTLKDIATYVIIHCSRTNICIAVNVFTRGISLCTVQFLLFMYSFLINVLTFLR